MVCTNSLFKSTFEEQPFENRNSRLIILEGNMIPLCVRFFFLSLKKTLNAILILFRLFQIRTLLKLKYH